MTRSEQDYSSKNDFETRRENQDLELQNISMSQQPLKSITFGTNPTKGTMSPIDSVPVDTKTPDSTPLTPPIHSPTRPTDSPEQKLKVRIPAERNPDPSSSDSSSRKSN